MAYQLLPFRFERFDENKYLLTNEVGEYIFLSNEDFQCFVDGKLDEHSELFTTSLPNRLPQQTRRKMWCGCLPLSSAPRKAFYVILPRCT